MKRAICFILVILFLINCGKEETSDKEKITLPAEFSIGTQHMIDSYVLIPEGPFLMGDDLAPPNFIEPERYVYLSTYAIGKYEVTNLQYTEFLNDYYKSDSLYIQDTYVYDKISEQICVGLDTILIVNKSRQNGFYFDTDSFKLYPGMEIHPAAGMTWLGAKLFTEWLTQKYNYQFDLPTKAQWIKAARGNIDDRLFPWGTWIEPSLCNYLGSRDPYETGVMAPYSIGPSTPIGYYIFDLNDTFPRLDNSSIYGAYDMCGNVYEFVNDWYDTEYYKTAPYRDPPGADTGLYKFCIGGGWGNPINHQYLTIYRTMAYHHIHSCAGFRPVLKNPPDL